jgi:hypothetical protein
MNEIEMIKNELNSFKNELWKDQIIQIIIKNPKSLYAAMEHHIQYKNDINILQLIHKAGEFEEKQINDIF